MISPIDFHLMTLRQQGVDINAAVDAMISEHAPPQPAEERALVLNTDQVTALEKIKAWLASDDPYFALRGFAGTGKSTLMRELLSLPHNFYFSAPTNKATKVLSEFLGVKCKTTYSLLGLRMVAEEDKRVLSATEVPDLGVNPILVIDEAGMLQRNVVNLLVELGYRVLFVGDPAQLNPIGEIISTAWRLAGRNRITLRKVERFDNALLHLSTALRDCLKDKVWKSPIVNTNDGKEGVFVLPRLEFERALTKLSLSDWDTTKVCCWRNRTVEGYNNVIREALGFTDDYCVGDRILLASPLAVNGNIIAYTDEEFVIKGIGRRVFNFDTFTIDTYVFDVGREFMLHVPTDPNAYAKHASRLASVASKEKNSAARKVAWKEYWSFVETFSQVRYGYALTAHRLQGTTVKDIYVDQADILANPNKPEAFRCLYVAATRPKLTLTTF